MAIRHNTKLEHELDLKYGGPGKFRDNVMARLRNWEPYEVIAEENGIHPATLYRWTKRWEAQTMGEAKEAVAA